MADEGKFRMGTLKLDGYPGRMNYYYEKLKPYYPSNPRMSFLDSILSFFPGIQNVYQRSESEGNRLSDKEIAKLISMYLPYKEDIEYQTSRRVNETWSSMPGSSFVGYYGGVPVYVHDANSKNAGYYAGTPSRGYYISLNRYQERPAEDILRHEYGHHAATSIVPSSNDSKYRQILEELERNMTLENYEKYITTPQESIADWLGGLYGSWSNEPSENPMYVNTIYDRIAEMKKLREDSIKKQYRDNPLRPARDFSDSSLQVIVNAVTKAAENIGRLLSGR